MTYSDFRAQIRRELEEPVAGVWADASLLVWTNAAAAELAMRTRCFRDWKEMTTGAGTALYDLPDYILEVIDVFSGLSTESQLKLIRQDFQEWASIPLDSSTARPQFYMIDGASIMFRPSPNDAYDVQLLCYAIPDPIDADADAMPFDSRYDSALAYYVKAKAFEQVNDWQSADAMLVRYENEVERITAQENKERNTGRAVTPREVW